MAATGALQTTNSGRVVHCAAAEGRLWLWFPYDVGIKDSIKTIPGSRWVPERRMWNIPGGFAQNLYDIFHQQGVHIQGWDGLPDVAPQMPAVRPVPPGPVQADVIRFSRLAGMLALQFKYDRVLVGLIRTIPGRWWHPDEKYWTIPERGLDELYSALLGREWRGTIWDDDCGRAWEPEESSMGGRPSGEGGGRQKEERQADENGIREVMRFEEAFSSGTEIPDIDISDVDFRASGGRVMEHQKDFMKFAKARLAENSGGILVCDEQGLGKTLESINLALYRRKTEGLKHCLVICCVNSNVRNWADEIEMHTSGEEKAHVLGMKPRRGGGFSIGSTKDRLHDLKRLESGEELPFFLVTNIVAIRATRRQKGAEGGKKKRDKYPIEEAIVRLIHAGEIGMVIVDEVHRNTSHQSRQGRCLWRIHRKTAGECTWVPMTGTPLVNRPTDLFLPLGLCGGHEFTSYTAFQQHFCPQDEEDARSGRRTKRGGTITDFRNLLELRSALKRMMIRRTKDEALDLPPKTHVMEYVAPTAYQKNLAERVREEIEAACELELETGEPQKEANPLAGLLRLRQVNGSPEAVDETLVPEGRGYLAHNAKMKRLLELVGEILEKNEKAIVFSNWTTPIAVIQKYLGQLTDVAVMTGDTSPQERQEQKRRFQEDPSCGVICGTIGAMGVGLTLTAAQHVIFYDEPWTPADKEQAEDRAHRIGTTGTVFIHTLITEGTVDEKVHDIIYSKKQTADLLVDGRMNTGGRSVDIRNDPALLRMLIMADESDFEDGAV